MSPHDDLSIDVSQIAPVHLELETARSHDLVGPYGAFVATMAPAEMAPRPEWRSPSAAPARHGALEQAADALATVPFGVWKRVALYSFLFLLFGNLLRCSGLSFFTNVTGVLVLMLGLAGCSASSQRSP